MANKVLILTASYGEGHNAAARNLREALEFISPEIDPATGDWRDRAESARGGRDRQSRFRPLEPALAAVA
jgi:hypothetical protein